MRVKNSNGVTAGVSAGYLRGMVCRAKGNRAGFTIVETMVVLAVTGVLFVVIAASLSGRQNAAEFTQAVQSAQAQIQQIINQVEVGYYSNQSNFSCTNGGGSVVLSAGSSSQGTNKDCVFLGKVIQFGVRDTDPEQYRVYTIASLRNATAGTTSPFELANPTVIGVGGDYTSYSTAQALKYGLTTLWVRSAGNDIGAVGLLMEPGSADGASATGYVSGAQQVDLVPLPGTSLHQTLAQTVAAINNRLNDVALTADAPINPSDGVQICFVGGGTEQSGLLTIGSTGRQLLVKLDIKSNKTCS